MQKTSFTHFAKKWFVKEFFFFFFCVPQLYLWGSLFLGEIFAYAFFFNPTIKVVTFCLRGWCVLGVFLLPAFTRVEHEHQSMQWNACAHRLDLSLYSHLKEFFGGMEFEPMLTPREKSPLPENFPRGGSNPRCCGQRAQTLPTSYSGPVKELKRMVKESMK